MHDTIYEFLYTAQETAPGASINIATHGARICRRCTRLSEIIEIHGRPTLAELFGLIGDEISPSSLGSYEVKHTLIQRRRFQRLLLAHAARHVGPHVPVAVLLPILPTLPTSPLLCV